MNWFTYGILSAVFFAAMLLIVKRILQLGVTPIPLYFSICILLSIGFGGWMRYSGHTLRLDPTIIGLLVAAAIFSLFANYFQITAIDIAPNPGYATALTATQIIFITVASALLLGTAIGPAQFIGVVLVVAGVALISV